MNEDSNSEYTVIELIQRNYSEMSSMRKKIADYILANPEECLQQSITTIAQKSGIKSESSIVRFYKMLGFDSFTDFKIHLAQDMVGNTFFHSVEDICMNDNIGDIKRKFISGSISSLSGLLNQQDDNAYESIANLILNSKRVILLGFAASAAICYYAYFRFLELGINCHFSSDSHINAAALANPNSDDVVICVSVSGETSDILRQVLPRKANSGYLITITANPKSTLASISDVVLSTVTQESSVVTDAMNARLLQLCSVDILYSYLCTRIGSDALSRLSNTRQVFRNYKYIPEQ